jgi:single-strand DNA-binding protein
MPNYNRVILAGHLTRDPQLRFTPNQVAVCEFGMAINRKMKDGKQDVTFVDVTAWNKTAETIQKCFKKGAAILIEGRLTFQQWDDAATGKKRSKLFVTADSFTFVGGKVDDAPAAKPKDDPLFSDKPKAGETTGDLGDDLDSDLPF